MLESSQAAHTYLFSQEVVCPRNRGWAEWQQAHAQAHVNSLFWLETTLLSPSLAPSWLISPWFCFVFYFFSLRYWDLNPELVRARQVHYCIRYVLSC